MNDFDGNGKAEQVVTHYAGDGRAYPLVLRDDLVKQLPGLRKSMGRYADYQGKRMEDIFPKEILERSVISEVDELRSLVVLNPEPGPTLRFLPAEAQIAPLYALVARDLNGDGTLDLLVAGNQSVGRPETGIYAGGFGVILLNGGDGNFNAELPADSGMYLQGDVRNMAPASAPGTFLVARSGGTLLNLTIK